MKVAPSGAPSWIPAHIQRDQALKLEVLRGFSENFDVYWARKVWRQMQRNGFDIARCTVERLMQDLGRLGVIPGEPVKTTIGDKATPYPVDQVNR